MPLPESSLAAARADLQSAQRILVVSHIRPDGDAIGSLLGIGLALQEAGKDVQLVLSDGLPASYRHLQGSNQVLRSATGPVDFVIVVDASDLVRTGDALNGYGQPDLNIDHHITNLNFARHNLVDPQAAAAAEVLALHMEDLGLKITPPVANALLTGIVADTIGFRTTNVTPLTLRLAAGLIEAGGNLTGVYYPALVSRSFSALQLWGAGLARLQKDDGIVWTALTRADRKAVGYPGRDDADLVNVLSAIENVDIAIIFVEQSESRVKISWRLCGLSAADLDVSQVALQFGGGGHKAAAGAEVDGALDHVIEQVLQATRALFIPKN